MNITQSMAQYKQYVGIFSIGIILCCLWGLLASAQPPNKMPTVTPTPTETPSQYINLLKSLEKSLLAEQEKTQQLENQRAQMQQFAQKLEAELNAYKIQISAYNSLLLVPDTPIEELEHVRSTVRSALDNIEARLNEFHEGQRALEQERVKTQEQYALNQKQLNEFQSDSPETPLADAETQELLEKLQIFTDLLSEKQEIIDAIQGIYADLIAKFQDIQQDFTTLLNKFDTQIEEQKSRELFERKANPFALLGWKQFQLELEQLASHTSVWFSPKYWNERMTTLWNTNRLILFRFVLFFTITLFLLIRFRRFLAGVIENVSCERFPWRCLVCRVVQRSFLLFGVTLFLYVYLQTRALDESSEKPALIALHILMIVLFSDWLLNVLTLWKQKRGETAPGRLLFHVRICVLIIRYFAIVYVIIEAVLGSSSVILLVARALFEITLFVWSILFWELFRNTPQQLFSGGPAIRRQIRTLTVGLGYIIASSGLLIELAGYGLLAKYWYVSWGQTLIVLLWADVIILALREWEKDIQQMSETEQESLEKASHQFHWLVVRLSWVILPGLVLTGLLFAWGGRQYVLVGAGSVLTYPVPIGGLNLRLLGIIYAVLILLVTHVATRFWRRILKTRILVNSGLDMGVQVSITTISVYVFWFFGILWALNALGVGTTSLTVAFGALGIGLGFGLQSIFNNFISGLILLFDRAIEVGDVVEMNGQWGVIEKINVRSTVVRTYDNSALIIPNSDIVSTQMTNWTFQDVRVRRTIRVGVAYGSDVKLVEQTLYEIAEKHPRVLRDPAPMVLFADFGDSSLNFILRVWALLDYGLTTETEIRFDIDRLFRERHIEIPFPQRDVHIRSGMESFSAQQTTAVPVPEPDSEKQEKP